MPITYANRPSGRDLNNYSDDDGQPRFPFGFGLSYTRFGYSSATVEKAVIMIATTSGSSALICLSRRI